MVLPSLINKKYGFPQIFLYLSVSDLVLHWSWTNILLTGNIHYIYHVIPAFPLPYIDKLINWFSSFFISETRNCILCIALMSALVCCNALKCCIILHFIILQICTGRVACTWIPFHIFCASLLGCNLLYVCIFMCCHLVQARIPLEQIKQTNKVHCDRNLEWDMVKFSICYLAKKWH